MSVLVLIYFVAMLIFSERLFGRGAFSDRPAAGGYVAMSGKCKCGSVARFPLV